ncbi:aminotransferase-like domain-containing protein [Microbacterium sp. NPDC055903]
MTREDRANLRLVDQGSAMVASDRLVARLGRWAHGDGTLSGRLAAAIAQLASTGELRPGDRLPAERALAAAASVSRGTVVAAYADLAERGVLERRQGSGTRIAGAAAAVPSASRPGRGEALFAALPSAVDLLRSVPEIPATAARIIQERSTGFDPRALAETDPAGLAVLRERIADLLTGEGTPTTPEQILVTHGAQQGLNLLVSELVGPGDVVLTEEVTWPGLSDMVRRRGGIVYGLSMGPDGMDVAALEAAIVRMRPVLVGVNPHHHNPTGTRMPAAARLRVAELAAQYGVPVVEDRVLAPVSFDGVVPPTLAGLRPDAPIIVVESVSKWAWAGLRIGWMRADPVLVRRLRGTRQLVDQSTSVPAQLLALGLIDQAPALRREISATHAQALRDLVRLLTEHLPEWRFTAPRGGLSLWLELPGGSAETFIRTAAVHGVAVAGSTEFAATTSPDDHVRIPYTAAPDVLSEGIRRLGEAWRDYRELL